MARLVLIHGAFGGAWVWEPVLEAPEAAGHKPEPVDLPGAGDDPTPLDQVTLDLYGLRICEVLAKGEPAVLVGQSMGGMAIAQAAAHCPGNISALVYVGAFAAGGAEPARIRVRGAARGRCVGDAAHHAWEHERADDHDR